MSLEMEVIDRSLDNNLEVNLQIIDLKMLTNNLRLTFTSKINNKNINQYKQMNQLSESTRVNLRVKYRLLKRNILEVEWKKGRAKKAKQAYLQTLGIISRGQLQTNRTNQLLKAILIQIIIVEYIKEVNRAR